MSHASALAALGLGLALFALPFLRYVHLGADTAPHADHGPRNGGVLRMVGDHHLELRRRMGRIELFVSDAVRNPIRPESAYVTFEGEYPEPMRIESDRLTAPDRAPNKNPKIEVQLNKTTILTWSGRT